MFVAFAAQFRLFVVVWGWCGLEIRLCGWWVVGRGWVVRFCTYSHRDTHKPGPRHLHICVNLWLPHFRFLQSATVHAIAIDCLSVCRCVCVCLWMFVGVSGSGSVWVALYWCVCVWSCSWLLILWPALLC